MQDFRHAWRALRRSPGLTVTAVITLALGIGANTAMFSVIHGVLLTPLPYRDPSRLVRLSESRPDSPVMNVSYPDFLDWRARSHVFDDLAIYNPYSRAVVGGAGMPSEAVPAATVEARMFGLLGVTLARGRVFAPDEEKEGAPAVVIISYRLWQRRFAGAARIVGQSIDLDTSTATVVGVLPADFRLQTADVWYPLAPSLSAVQLDRQNHPGFQAIGRLRGGVTTEAAQREMSAIAAAIEREHPETNHQIGVVVRPVLDAVVGNVRPMLWLLSGAVGLLLLIACANLANALLARGLRRERETAVRAALGAGRLRLARLFLAESTLIAGMGAAAAIVVALWGVRAVRGLPAILLPRAMDVALSPVVLTYAVGLAALMSVLCGLVPALQLSRADLMSRLRQAGVGSASPSGRRTRGLLIALEVALSLMLLVGASLMLRTVARLALVDPGYRPDGLLTVNLQQPHAVYSHPTDATRFAAQLIDGLQNVPGVASAAAAWPLDQVSFGWMPYVNSHDRPFPAGQEPPVRMAAVTDGFFATMGMAVRRGRTFGPADRQGAPVVVVVNETLVKRLLPGGDPIGRRLSVVSIPELADVEVVGVVGDTVRAGLSGRPGPEMYCAYAQFPQDSPTIIVRAVAGDPLRLVRLVQDRIEAIDPRVATFGVRRLADALADTVGDRRLLSTLLAIFAALALGLTSVGIGGVMAYVVAQRTWEIGVRMALGADASSVLRAVLGSMMWPVVAGLCAGLAATLPFTRVIQRFLFDVAPTDPLALTAAVLALLLAAFTAAFIPARRATRIDPLAALRE